MRKNTIQTNGERMARIETDIQYIKEKQEEHNDADLAFHARMEEYMQFQEKRHELQQKEFDEKYASKNVERVVYAGIGIILTFVVVGLIGLLLK